MFVFVEFSEIVILVNFPLLVYLPQQILIEFGARVIVYQLGGVARASFTPSPTFQFTLPLLLNF